MSYPKKKFRCPKFNGKLQFIPDYLALSQFSLKHVFICMHIYICVCVCERVCEPMVQIFFNMIIQLSNKKFLSSLVLFNKKKIGTYNDI